jgi:hypothetical protein
VKVEEGEVEEETEEDEKEKEEEDEPDERGVPGGNQENDHEKRTVEKKIENDKNQC